MGCCCPNKPTCEPQLIEVDLSSMQPHNMTITIQTPTTSLVLPPPLANTIDPSKWHCHSHQPCSSRGLGAAAAGFLPQSQPLSLGAICQGREPPSAALGAPPSAGEQKIPSGQKGWTLSSLPQCNPHADIFMGGYTRWHPQVHSYYSPLLQPTVPKTLEVASMCMFPSGCDQLDSQIN